MFYSNNESGKREITEEIELPYQERIRTLREKDKYLRILEAATIKQAEIEEKKRNEYLRRKRKLCETKLCSRNIIKWINTRSSPSSKIWTILKMDEGENQTNESKDKKVDNDSQDITSER